MMNYDAVRVPRVVVIHGETCFFGSRSGWWLTRPFTTLTLTVFARVRLTVNAVTRESDGFAVATGHASAGMQPQSQR